MRINKIKTVYGITLNGRELDCILHKEILFFPALKETKAINFEWDARVNGAILKFSLMENDDTQYAHENIVNLIYSFIYSEKGQD